MSRDTFIEWIQLSLWKKASICIVIQILKRSVKIGFMLSLNFLPISDCLWDVVVILQWFWYPQSLPTPPFRPIGCLWYPRRTCVRMVWTWFFITLTLLIIKLNPVSRHGSFQMHGLFCFIFFDGGLGNKFSFHKVTLTDVFLAWEWPSRWFSSPTTPCIVTVHSLQSLLNI